MLCSVDLNGDNRKKVLQSAEYLAHPFALTVFEVPSPVTHGCSRSMFFLCRNHWNLIWRLHKLCCGLEKILSWCWIVDLSLCFTWSELPLKLDLYTVDMQRCRRSQTNMQEYKGQSAEGQDLCKWRMNCCKGVKPSPAGSTASIYGKEKSQHCSDELLADWRERTTFSHVAEGNLCGITGSVLLTLHILNCVELRWLLVKGT